MKILIVGNARYVAQYGGGEVYVKNLIAGLVARQHEIIYFSISPDHNKDAESKLSWFDQESFKECQLSLPSVWLESDYRNHAIEQVSAVFLKICPAVIHAHAWKQIIVLAGAAAKIPTVVTAHHGGIVCPAGALLNYEDKICSIPASDQDCLRCCVKSVPGYKVWYPLIKLVPLKIRLVLGTLFSKFPFILFLTPLALVTRSIQTKQQEVKDIADFASCVIAPSPAISQALVLNWMPAKKICIVPHGIPLPARSTAKRLVHAPLRLIYVGRISYVKGLHILLSACSSLAATEYELHIVGSSFTRAEKKYEARLKCQFATVKAVWHGHKNRDEINQLLNECDVMVHPAIFLEVFGLTIAESLAVGCPVVATRCGGPEIQIQDGVNGLLVPPNDADALRAALQHLIDSPALIQKMSLQSGLVRSIEEHVLDIEKVYCSCIDKASMPASS